MYWGKRLINLSFSKKSWFWPRNRANEAYIFLCLLLTVRDIHTLLHEQQGGGGLAACLKKSTLKCVVCSWLLLQIHLNCVTKHLFRKLISWHGMGTKCTIFGWPWTKKMFFSFLINIGTRGRECINRQN